MKISVMWMTRNRPYELIYSLSSFIIRAKNNSDVEYIVISDPDDVETPDALKKIKPMVFDTDIISLVAPQRYGYEELEMYQNQVGKVFTGECLLIVNDDIICLNENWDEAKVTIRDAWKVMPVVAYTRRTASIMSEAPLTWRRSS